MASLQLLEQARPVGLYLIRLGGDNAAVTCQIEIVKDRRRTVEPRGVRAELRINAIAISHSGAVRLREHILKGHNRNLIDGLDGTLSSRVVATNWFDCVVYELEHDWLRLSWGKYVDE